MNLTRLDIRDPRVQEFLWRYLEPTDFRHDYTKLDAIRYVEAQAYDGSTQLWGDLDAGFMFRVTVRNPKVMEPHIMGNAAYLRSAMRQGVGLAWEMGFEKLAIWTQHEAVVRIASKCGFSLEGRLPKLHMGPGGELLDLYVLVMEKP